MNKGHFKDRLCWLCLPGTVVTSLPLTNEVSGLSAAISSIWEKNLSLNSANAVKTFRKNSNGSCASSTTDLPLDSDTDTDTDFS